MSSLNHFLLIFDHAVDSLVSMEDFKSDGKAATAAYEAAEKANRDNALIDIVLIGSDSIETVKVTHSNYFTGMNQSSLDRIFDSPMFA